MENIINICIFKYVNVLKTLAIYLSKYFLMLDLLIFCALNCDIKPISNVSLKSEKCTNVVLGVHLIKK